MLNSKSSTFILTRQLIISLSVSQIVFYWSPSGSYTIGISIDEGSLTTGSSLSGAATLSTTAGDHTATFQVACSSGGNCSGEAFGLTDVVITTECVSSGNGVNATLDDASSLITYSGFTSTQQSTSGIGDIKQGEFYNNTVSYTSTSGATASFSFDGSALYVFGMTGPSFGIFTISIDGKQSSNLSSFTTIDQYEVLLYFTTGLSDTTHQVVITNQGSGTLFALDYVVAVSQGTGENGGSGSTTVVVGSAGGGGQTMTNSATAVFPSLGMGSSESNANTNNSSNVSGIIGGVLGTILGLGVLYIAWRYHMYKKAGGQGDLLTALFGKSKNEPQPKKESTQSTFKPWAYLKYQPKYATER